MDNEIKRTVQVPLSSDEWDRVDAMVRSEALVLGRWIANLVRAAMSIRKRGGAKDAQR